MLKLLVRFTFVTCLFVPFASAASAAALDAEVGEAKLIEIEQLASQATELNKSIQTKAVSLQILDDNIDRADGDRLAVLELERQKKALEILDELFTLAENLKKQDGLGAVTTDLRDQVVSYLVRVSNSLDQYLDGEDNKLELKRSRAADLQGIDLIVFEQEMAADVVWMEKLLSAKIRTVEEMDRLGLSTVIIGRISFPDLRLWPRVWSIDFNLLIAR